MISYASRSLTETEQRYSQIERECLSITYACQRNRLYLFAREFTIFNDNKALVNLLNNPKSKLPLRIERMLLKTQGFYFKTFYVTSNDNISDYISRHPTNQTITSTNIEKQINNLTKFSVPFAFTIQDLKTATLADPLLQQLIELKRNGNWHTVNRQATNEQTEHLKAFQKIEESITVNDEQNIVLKDSRIVLPKIYHNVAIKPSHQGHQGLCRTKALLRSKVFFWGMDKKIEHEIANCVACQAITKPKPPSPLKPSVLPHKVWETVNMDYLGPLPNGKYLLVIIDQRSKYPVVAITSSTSAKNLISIFDKTFSHFGYPENVVTDNGPPFKSNDVKNYMREKAIAHRRITPLWPQANGEVERFMQPLTKVLRAAKIEQKDWERELHSFLMAYRHTPHTTTKVSPAEVMFHRKLRYTIPTFRNTIDKTLHQKIDQNDKISKEKSKQYQDKRCHAADRTILIGDRVLVKQTKQNKLTPNFNPNPYTVTNVNGTMITATNPVDNHIITRNISHFKPLPLTAPAPYMKNEYQEEEEEELQGVIRPNPEVEVLDPA